MGNHFEKAGSKVYKTLLSLGRINYFFVYVAVLFMAKILGNRVTRWNLVILMK